MKDIIFQVSHGYLWLVSMFKLWIQPTTYISEVWLEWPITTGSTLFRNVYKNRLSAFLGVRYHAWLIDSNLPKYFLDSDWSGNPIWVEYEYGIMFGIRLPTEKEKKEGVYTYLQLELPPATKSSEGKLKTI